MYGKKFAIDIAKSKESRVDVARSLQHVRTNVGKSYFAQLREMLSLSRGLGRISPEDYYCYRLYDSAFDAAEKKRFVSDRVHHQIIRQCCDIHWWGMADDKLAAYTLLRSFGAPVPETYAVYHPGIRNCGPFPTCRTAEALAKFLRNDARYPFFAKPIGGIASYGASLVRSYDGSTDTLALSHGEQIGVNDYVEQMTEESGGGYVFEEVLRPHPVVGEITGDRLCTIRVVIIFTDNGPEILHTIWKITVGENIADNFWRPGNMLAAVDTETGEVTRVVRGVGLEQVEADVHPNTGKAIKRLVLPDWERLRALCTGCAAIFPKLRYQSWDVALCPCGPVIVEVNTGSAFLLPQVATGKGFLDERFTKFLEACGVARPRQGWPAEPGALRPRAAPGVGDAQPIMSR